MEITDAVGEILLRNNLKNIMETKKWYQSWTVWFNIALLAVDVINQLAQIVPIAPGFLSLVGVFGNLLLRFKTTSAIK